MRQLNRPCDPYFLHRLALRPFLRDKKSYNTEILLQDIENSGRDNFLIFLREQGLAPLWYGVLSAIQPLPCEFHPLLEKLHLDRLNAVASYIMQKNTMEKIHAAFTSAEISYAIFKGTQVRELVYAEPALRPASDIDVLVNDCSREHAIQVLDQLGMRKIETQQNLSHECTVTDATVQVDLHWHILRPGRLPPDTTKILLGQTQLINGFYGLNNDATLFVILIHPAFAKYVCSPYATMNRALDLYFWVQQKPCDWHKLVQWTGQFGIGAAAWATLYWLNLLTSNSDITEILRIFQPGAIRRRYLAYWIDNNLPTKWIRHRQLMRFGFTLGLHDNVGIMLRFLTNTLSHK